MAKATDQERRMLDMLRKADAVFMHFDDDLRTFSWIRGLSEAPTRVQVEYAKGHAKGAKGHAKDGVCEGSNRIVRRLTIKMGVTEKEWNALG